MRKAQVILAVTLLGAGVALAGTSTGNYEKMVVTPEPVCGPWYVSAYGGGSFYDRAEYQDASGFGIDQGFVNLDNGWIIGGAVGLRTPNAWRFELDLNHNQSPVNSLNAVSPFDFASGPARGEIERTSLMVNAVKEFRSFQFLGVTPYLGAGVGLTNVGLDVTDVGGSFMTADELVLGYQAMAGLALDVTECLQVFAEYRLMGTGDLEDAKFAGSAGDLDLGLSQHAILGVRWSF